LVVFSGTQVPGWAQNTPDLSGQWVFVEERSTATPTVPRIYNTTGAPAGSNELSIVQTPAAVNITIGGVEFTYRLDGTEGNVSADGRAGFPIGGGAWAGQRLVVTLTQEVFSAARSDYVKVPIVETYSVADGALTVGRTRTHLDGSTTSEELVYMEVSQ
jgi:hypothetical protein